MNPKICPTCHSPIPPHAPGGFCPACLLRDAEEPPTTGHAAPSLEEIAAAFPQLEIVRLIGQGGMGFIYQARQTGLDRTVALKILSPELGRDPAFAERFAREARALGKLNHPNIVTVFEHGESGGFFYLIMEFVDGVNLRQAMRAGRFTPEQALAIVPGICDALQAAHAQGIWHRDIKPENILLDAHGGVKIADFGIARMVGDPHFEFTLTQTGGALGSAAYMAPEQHENPRDVDHRADIYSLGVVIYEMLTGELPLGRFPAPSQRAAVNARIDEIVFRALEKERELRQQSATEVKTNVQQAAQAENAENAGIVPARGPHSAASMKWPWILMAGGAGLLLAFSFTTDPFIVGHFWRKLFSPVSYRNTTLSIDPPAYLQFLKLWSGGGLVLLLGGAGLAIAGRIRRGKPSHSGSQPQLASADSHTAKKDQAFAWSIGLWLGGIAGVVAGLFTAPLLTGLGCVAAVLGLIGCGRLLLHIRQGRHPQEHLRTLLTIAYWPVVAGLCCAAAVGWFSAFKNASPSEAPAVTGALYGYAALAITAPLIAARLLWKLFGTDPATQDPRRDEWPRAVIATLVIFCTLALVKWVVERETSCLSYRAGVIQIYGEISKPEAGDLALVREAVDRAVGEHRSNYRIHTYGSQDAASPWSFPGMQTPYVVMEFISRDDVNMSQQDFNSIAQRLRASLPKRIGVNSQGLQVTGAVGEDCPKDLRRAYQQARPLNVVFLFAPILIVLLATTSRRPLPWVLPLLAFASTVVIDRSPWPAPIAGLPPSATGLKPLPSLPMPEYDFSTTRDAMESLIKAANKGDEEAFKRGISSKLLEKVMSEVPDLSEPMRDISKLTYHHQVSQNGDTARAQMTNKETEETEVISLIRDNQEWKVALPDKQP